MHYNTKIKTKLKYRANNSYSARNAIREMIFTTTSNTPLLQLITALQIGNE